MLAKQPLHLLCCDFLLGVEAGGGDVFEDALFELGGGRALGQVVLQVCATDH